jgi:hypothetical protein
LHFVLLICQRLGPRGEAAALCFNFLTPTHGLSSRKPSAMTCSIKIEMMPSKRFDASGVRAGKVLVDA